MRSIFFKASAALLLAACAAPAATDADSASSQNLTDEVTATAHRCGGFAGFTCDEHEFCEMTREDACGMADAMGTCRAKPDVCPQMVLPVCGCNGQTYGNYCFAAMAGVAIAADGPCAAN